MSRYGGPWFATVTVMKIKQAISGLSGLTDLVKFAPGLKFLKQFFPAKKVLTLPWTASDLPSVGM